MSKPFKKENPGFMSTTMPNSTKRILLRSEIKQSRLCKWSSFQRGPLRLKSFLNLKKANDMWYRPKNTNRKFLSRLIADNNTEENRFVILAKIRRLCICHS